MSQHNKQILKKRFKLFIFALYFIGYELLRIFFALFISTISLSSLIISEDKF